MSDKLKYSENRRVGNIGEDVVASYLKSSGFVIIDRNYLKKFGEIDIIAKKSSIVHFIEVKSKSISREMYQNNLESYKNIVSRLLSRFSFTNKKFKIEISREITDNNAYRPEENVHDRKQKNLLKTIEYYMAEKGIENEWQVDIATVSLDFLKKTAIINHIENVVLDA